jgi:DNA-binding NarL/FixJ family response regulator
MIKLLLALPNQTPIETDGFVCTINNPYFDIAASEDICASFKIYCYDCNIYNTADRSDALRIYKQVKELNQEVVGILLVTRDAAEDAEKLFWAEHLSLMPATILPSGVIRAVNLIRKGYICAPRFMLQALRQELIMGKPANSGEGMPLEKRLTPREGEINELIGRGYSNREIAERLFISVSTVKSHVYNIFRKTSIKNRTQAIIMRQ